MILKDSNNPILFLKKLRDKFLEKKKLFFVLVYTLCVFGCGAIFVIFAVSDQISQISLRLPFKKTSYKYNPRISKPEKIDIGLSQKDYLKLFAKRNRALNTGFLISDADDYVPAKIRYKDKTVRVKMRLKGDVVDHFQGKAWSFRVSVKDKETLFGMREFALHHPRVRGWIYGWIFHEIVRRDGLIGLPTRFIDVSINGENLGVFNVEAHFDKFLIEANKFREGPIIKFNEDLLWANRARNFSNNEMENSYFASSIDVFQPGQLRKDEDKRLQYEIAFNLLENFRLGKLSVEQVFDVKQTARYYAYADLFGASHMTEYHNIRFYYNPIDSKLQPIVFDTHCGVQIKMLIGQEALRLKEEFYDFNKKLFSDPSFMQAYLKELTRLSQADFLEGQMKAIDKELKKNLNILHRDYSDFFYDKNIFFVNRGFIMNALNPIKGILAYFERYKDKQLVLRLSNIEGLPIKVEGISRAGVRLFQPAEEAVLPPKEISKPVNYELITFDPKGSIMWSDELISELEVDYRIEETPFMKKAQIFPWPKYDAQFGKKDLIRQKPNYRKFSFLNVDDDKKMISFKPGNWVIKENVVLPRGYHILAHPGVQIDLRDNAKIVSYSPFLFLGRWNAPIIVQSSDETGQGIAVLNAEEWSQFEYVLFYNLSAPKQAGWKLTGALTFYQSPVRFLRCEFDKNLASDDFLNIIRSEFEVSDSRFANTFADAIDVDFGQGNLKNLSFLNIGNDAIDFSGSYVTGKTIQISDAKDKGLSVGEASEVELDDVDIRKTGMALACKDSSRMLVSTMFLEDCKVGIAIYEKKPEFGPAFVQIERYEKSNVQNPYLVSSGSTLIINRVWLSRKGAFQKNEIDN